MKIASIIYLILLVLTIIGAWKVFVKAGKPGWAVLIPIYDGIVLLEIVGKPWWWLLLILFVPFANIVFAIWTVNLLSKSFGLGVGFTIGLIILPFIFVPILGFGSAEYKGPVGSA